MLKLSLFLTAVLCFSLAFSAESTTSDSDSASTAAAGQAETSSHDASTTSIVEKHPLGLPRYSLGELSFLPGGAIGHAITGGAVAIGVVLILLIASFFYPLSSFKGLCSLTDSCVPSSNYRVDTYPTPGALSASSSTYADGTYNSPYSQPGAYAPSYQKRSLEYVGPILKMLNAAYEKYGKPQHHLNSIQSQSTDKSSDKARRRRR